MTDFAGPMSTKTGLTRVEVTIHCRAPPTPERTRQLLLDAVQTVPADVVRIQPHTNTIAAWVAEAKPLVVFDEHRVLLANSINRDTRCISGTVLTQQNKQPTRQSALTLASEAAAGPNVTIVAATFCELQRLDSKRLYECLEKFPVIDRKIRRHAAERVKELEVNASWVDVAHRCGVIRRAHGLVFVAKRLRG